MLLLLGGLTRNSETLSFAVLAIVAMFLTLREAALWQMQKYGAHHIFTLLLTTEPLDHAWYSTVLICILISVYRGV